MLKKNVSVGLLGLGVVGSGVVNLIKNYQEDLRHELDCGVEVKSVLVRDIDKARTVDINEDLLTTNPQDVLQNPEIDVIVEVMGGVEGTREYLLEAFKAKKHVITAN